MADDAARDLTVLLMTCCQQTGADGYGGSRGNVPLRIVVFGFLFDCHIGADFVKV